VAALAPDIDAVLMPFGWDRYLRVHEIGTHSLAGSLVVAGVVALIARTLAPRRPGLDLLMTAWLVCLSHLALDLLSGARIQIGWPLVAGRVSLPLVAMADPWLLGILLVCGVALVRSRLRRHAAWTILSTIAAFLIVKAILLGSAQRPAPPEPGSRVRAHVVEADWASLTTWRVLERRGGVLMAWRVGPGRPPTLILSHAAGPDSLWGGRSRALDTVRNFLHVHELAFAVERPDAAGGVEILWSDLRFCRPPPGDIDTASASGRGRPIVCDVWSGGLLDATGRVVSQVVTVGGWRQTREPAR
jgi:membrane-bound metal-dependent hydrolase YbcI (DUF457 family)